VGWKVVPMEVQDDITEVKEEWVYAGLCGSGLASEGCGPRAQAGTPQKAKTRSLKTQLPNYLDTFVIYSYVKIKIDVWNREYYKQWDYLIIIVVIFAKLHPKKTKIPRKSFSHSHVCISTTQQQTKIFLFEYTNLY